MVPAGQELENGRGAKFRMGSVGAKKKKRKWKWQKHVALKIRYSGICCIDYDPSFHLSCRLLKVGSSYLAYD